MFSHNDYQTTNAKRAMEKTICWLQVLGKSHSLLVLILQHYVVYVHCRPLPPVAAHRRCIVRSAGLAVASAHLMDWRVPELPAYHLLPWVSASFAKRIH